MPVFFIPLAGGLIGQAAADPGDTASMQTAELDGAALFTASAAFALLALLPFLAIVGYQLLGGESAARRLTSLKEVLLRNNHKVMFWVTGVLGTVFLAQAIPFG